MSCRIIYDPVENIAAFYDSVSGHAFGPVFEHGDDAEQDAIDFADWLPTREWQAEADALGVKPNGEGNDPRHWDNNVLDSLVAEWRRLYRTDGT